MAVLWRFQLKSDADVVTRLLMCLTFLRIADVIIKGLASG